MLKVEAALARAEAEAGLVPKNLAGAIARLSADEFDMIELGQKTADAGVVAIPFVKALEAKLSESLRPHVHKGATSQDIVDTALVLQMAEAFGLIAGDLAAIIDGLSALARKYRRTVCVGRTYGQHAAPVTFGFVAATWLDGLAEIAGELPRLRQRVLVASLGGPVGTLAALGEAGERIGRRFARELGLGYAATNWHTSRGRIVAVATWLAALIAALARIATDVAFLSATEVGEVSEAHGEGRGGSSAMPHKRNPVSSSVILAAHAAAPGLAATLLTASSSGQQRPLGLWQAEWLALPQLFGLASGALREARCIAEGLVVDARRMRANLDLTRGLIFTDAVAAALSARGKSRSTAQQTAARAADTVRDSGATLRDALVADGVPAAVLAAAFDLKPAIEAAAAIVDRALKDSQTVKRTLRKA
jgi:3-carboxy-cis,cis-muconate cycloisomerase